MYSSAVTHLKALLKGIECCRGICVILPPLNVVDDHDDNGPPSPPSLALVSESSLCSLKSMSSMSSLSDIDTSSSSAAISVCETMGLHRGLSRSTSATSPTSSLGDMSFSSDSTDGMRDNNNNNHHNVAVAQSMEDRDKEARRMMREARWRQRPIHERLHPSALVGRSALLVVWSSLLLQP